MTRTLIPLFSVVLALSALPSAEAIPTPCDLPGTCVPWSPNTACSCPGTHIIVTCGNQSGCRPPDPFEASANIPTPNCLDTGALEATLAFWIQPGGGNIDPRSGF